ncbi:hypothetical protein K6119_14570 [Paracrocinitomix mangrovi]|uniref:hypothetical protein n=1 Tax=Paracrocinitomix mangrovi TaxID=2862509 RepID=UPI001C8E3B7C|nr:hypothetical protein [Paracrocinitomix mangrovi]UKN00956.1 hypothetical protein K6119_14570 [Paracrocinitomix mangrovi]
MKCLLATSFLFFAFYGNAQTKLIAFKSHSGNMNYFISAIESNSFDMEPHNLGMAPRKIVQFAQLDTVVKVNDSTAILVTTDKCKDEYRPHIDPSIWKEGTDTVYNHPLWTCGNKDSIKDVVKRDFHFSNNIDSTVFIGFDQIEEQKKNDQDSVPPVLNEDGTKQNNNYGIPIAIVFVVMLSVIIYLINWRRAHFKNSTFEQYA